MTTFAGTISQGSSETIVIPYGRVIEVTTAGEASLVYDDGDIARALNGAPLRIPANRGDLRLRVRAVSALAHYSIFLSNMLAGGDRVIPFTGDRTLSLDDNGKILRCDDGSNVTVTVPGALPECFNVGFIMMGGGTVTLSAGSGATNRSSGTTLSTQYQKGSLLVARNTNDAAAEYLTSGDFA
ncbi:hypothetical protein [Bradyrhizobium sp. MOS002]|uniref:hypothetical protein n=1 Tax=Bradyrhizobium sp. MOS002 TaxID=2133947 RepID=UPI000D12DD0B|nr:hypothetical protein [Bradyrhizobium sp. MOS002]PSO29847.1 hypothetical protein C7G41_24190 [Bradyrhizobium sp. MOS002]